MGWKYDEGAKEWITTEEYYRRSNPGCYIIAIIVIVGPILPARLLKWMFGYGFWPDEWSLWQFTGDVCLSLPFYVVLIALIWVVRTIRA